MEWYQSERLNDPNYFIPAVLRALEEMVGDNNWLFDRSVFSSKS